MPNSDGTFNVFMSVQGPIGKTGPKGDPGFLQFRIENGNLILINETPDAMNFVIVNGNLIMEVNE